VAEEAMAKARMEMMVFIMVKVRAKDVFGKETTA